MWISKPTFNVYRNLSCVHLCRLCTAQYSWLKNKAKIKRREKRMEKVLKSYKDVESGFHNTFSLIHRMFTIFVWAYECLCDCGLYKCSMPLFYRIDEWRVRLMRYIQGILCSNTLCTRSVSLIGGLIWLYPQYVVWTVQFTRMDEFLKKFFVYGHIRSKKTNPKPTDFSA